MTVDVQKMIQIYEDFDLSEDVCTFLIEKAVLSQKSVLIAAEKIFYAATKNTVSGISENIVLVDLFEDKSEFSNAIGYEILESFIELTINFIFYQILAFTYEEECHFSYFCVSASTFKLFKVLKNSYKMLRVIKVAKTGNTKKAMKLFFKYSSKEIGKILGQSMIPIPVLSTIIGSLFGGVGKRIFM